MGQKVNPHSFRVGATLFKNWSSIYYAEAQYGNLVIEDVKIRRLVQKKCAAASISEILIERSSNKSLVLNIYVKRPGVIIGKSGADIESLKTEIKKITQSELFINIHEVKRPDMDAQLIASGIAFQLVKRVSFRRAMKKAMQTCLKSGAKGIKVSCAGRLGGAEIARTEWYREGRVPLHTLRADIDYSTALAHTTYGVIGIKVWVYKGDISETKKKIK